KRLGVLAGDFGGFPNGRRPGDDVVDIQRRLLPAERHLIRRLVAFFATGDSIVANNLVLNLYAHINSPEARLFLSRQLYE
ncbi:MAG TPA: ribonucleotide-diphosphate reductase subunit beta, partial [Ilumatobacteraceae bacterium]|nr:ribonucleotide-diphosphate reductase subunit beta [Ilumatobacteraceae bacterium]